MRILDSVKAIGVVTATYTLCRFVFFLYNLEEYHQSAALDLFLMFLHGIRFDLVAVVWPEGERKPSRITHYENAFQATW